MESATNYLLDYGAMGIMLAIAIIAGYRAFKWFTGTHLPDIAKQRAQEMEALIGEFKAMRTNFTDEIGRLISHTDKAAEAQAQNEEKIVSAIVEVKAEIKTWSSKMENRIAKLEKRVDSLETTKK